MNIAKTLAALSDDTRRRILSLLAERGSSPAGVVADAFALSKPTISHHLRVLEDAALVRSERRGTSIVYTLQSNILEDAAAAVLALASPAASPAKKLGQAVSTAPGGRRPTAHPGDAAAPKIAPRKKVPS